jgi:hypothetical protein
MEVAAQQGFSVKRQQSEEGRSDGPEMEPPADAV